MLEVKNLNVSFKKQKVLDDFNLNIDNGEILGLLGKNGAGKTTFFESLFQNVKFSGEISWKNKHLKREQISYLETENYFYPYITGKEYLSTSEKGNITNPPWDKLLKRSYLKEINFSYTSGIIHDDAEALLRLFYNAEKVSFVNKFVYVYRIRAINRKYNRLFLFHQIRGLTHKDLNQITRYSLRI